MRVLITGNGQLAQELRLRLPAGVEAVVLSRQQLDIADADRVAAVMVEHRPTLIVNAAAYTAVDRAESEPQQAHAVNAEGPAHLARAALDVGARLIHVSTDFVFSGEGQSQPYQPGDSTGPSGVYGASKLAGEQAVQAILGEQAVIVRTAWVYSRFGQNFVKTMQRLMAEREQLGVVADQVGTPTWAGGLAEALWRLADKPDVRGILHWTDAGVASWYDFAVAIQEEALALGLLEKAIPLRPIRTADYPTPARRPAWSVLDKTDTWAALQHAAPHWRVALRRMLADWQQHGDKA